MPIYMNNEHQQSFDEMAKHLSQQTKQKSLTWLFFTEKKGGGDIMTAKTIN